MKKPITILLLILFTTILTGIAKSERLYHKPQHHTKDIRDSVYKILKGLNVRYPEVGTAQARLETANFTSRLCRESNNLFGMKKRYVHGRHAVVRYASYNSVYESCQDYAAYYNRRIANKINSREDYMRLLRSYSATHNYVALIRNIVRRSSYVDTI